MRLSKKEFYISAAFGFILGSIYVLEAVFTSDSSTAAIGLIFIPIYGGLGALLCIAGYYLLRRNWWTRLGFILIACILSFGLYDKNENIKSASDKNMPASYLVDLAQVKMLFGKEAVLIALAGNTSSPPELLQQLSTNESMSVRSKVAGNPSAPTNVLSSLSLEKFNYSLHAALASNPRISDQVIERLLSAKLSDFLSNIEYKLYQTYVLGPLARSPRLSEQDFLKITQIPNPEYFLIYGIIESGRASCELLKSYRDGDNGALNNNAQSQMTAQGCTE